MKQRMITSAAICGGMIAVLFLSWTPVFPAVLSFFAAVAVYEVLKVFGIDKKLFLAIPSYLIAAVMPCLAYILDRFNVTVLGIPHNVVFLLILASVAYAFLFYLFVVTVCDRGKLAFGDAACGFITVIYIVS